MNFLFKFASRGRPEFFKNTLTEHLKYLSNKNKFGLIDIYQKYFEDFRSKKFNLLEIGIDNGDSLRIWKDYFPNSHICGIDIIKKDFIIDNVDFYFGDQSNISFLKSLTDKVH